MIAWAITQVRTFRAMASLAERVVQLEDKFNATAAAIDVLDKRDDDLRARQDEFAKV